MFHTDLRSTAESTHDADDVHLVHVVVEDYSGLNHQDGIEHGNQNANHCISTCESENAKTLRIVVSVMNDLGSRESAHCYIGK